MNTKNDENIFPTVSFYSPPGFLYRSLQGGEYKVRFTNKDEN